MCHWFTIIVINVRNICPDDNRRTNNVNYLIPPHLILHFTNLLPKTERVCQNWVFPKPRHRYFQNYAITRIMGQF